MKKLTIEIEGVDYSDLADALEEIRAKVDEEYREGFDRNETGNYTPKARSLVQHHQDGRRLMEFASGTRVGLTGYPDMSGTIEFPEPDQEAPDELMVLVMWDGRSFPTWEYTEDLIVT